VRSRAKTVALTDNKAIKNASQAREILYRKSAAMVSIARTRSFCLFTEVPLLSWRGWD